MTTNNLLRPDAMRAYLNAPINSRLEAPLLPNGFADKTPNQLADRHALLDQLDVLVESQATDFVISSKNVPHAVCEVMWMDAGKTYRDAMTDLSDTDVQALCNEAADFVDYTSEQGMYPSISWSHDPQTVHRVSIQGEKRVHMHGVARYSHEVERAVESRMLVYELDTVARRRLMDEFSVLAVGIGTEIARESGFEVADIHPGLLSLYIGQTDVLRRQNFGANLTALLRRFDDEYVKTIERLGGEDDNGMLRSLGGVGLAVTGMIAADNGIDHFVKGLRAIDVATMRRFLSGTRKHYGKTFIPLKGLAYAVTLSPVDGCLFAHVRFCKFSDMGGAGCAVLEGVPTRVLRGQGVMTDDDVMHRAVFQDGFVKRLKEMRNG